MKNIKILNILSNEIGIHGAFKFLMTEHTEFS